MNMVLACDICGEVYHPDLVLDNGGACICPREECGKGVLIDVHDFLLPLAYCLAQKGYRVRETYIQLPHTEQPCIDIHFKYLYKFENLPEGFDCMSSKATASSSIGRSFDTTFSKALVYKSYLYAMAELFQWALDLPDNEDENSAA